MITFTLEYLIRLGCAPRVGSFVLSPVNVIDLVAFLPFWVQLMANMEHNATGLATLRMARVVRLVRVFSVSKYKRPLKIFGHAIYNSTSALILLMVLSVFLMVPVASAITSMFLDEVADAVEEVHYPHLPPANQVGMGDAIRDTVNFMGVLVGANLLALVLYLLFAPAALFIFWGLNGFLLGREYFTLAALRRHGRDETKRLRRRHAGTIWVAGVLMAVPLSVPLLNLLIPILGAATFTHLYHALVPHSDAANLRYPPR